MRLRSTWTRSMELLPPLLLAGCRIAQDMPVGEKIALGALYGVAIVALAALMVGLIALAALHGG